MSIIELNKQNIIDICQKHKVKTLAVFGSVLTDRFCDDSDIDFVVDFTDVDESDYADNYLEMQEALQNLLGREIDLLENKAIRNSILLQTINDSKQVIYG
ncbi:MAG: nucleotidyltransferase domain-containing protein [Bacteroidales bacterium]|nr:nucleotidyltransferase domain-containing protein [Bacteroidales bacterium]MDD6582723.1 nucleotidyltransferase domain-containing protein [Bacteroidales bacterium]